MDKVRGNDTIRQRVYRFVAKYLRDMGAEAGKIKSSTELTGRLGSKDFWTKISYAFAWEVWTMKSKCKTVGALASSLNKTLQGFSK